MGSASEIMWQALRQTIPSRLMVKLEQHPPSTTFL